MKNKDQIFLESIYQKIKEQYDAPQPVPPAQVSKQSENSSMQNMAGGIFRAAYTDVLKQRGYTDEQIKKYWEKFDKQKQDKTKTTTSTSGEINFQDPNVQNKIKQAYKAKGYTDEDLTSLDNLFKPDRVNSLKTSMLANGIDINTILK